MGTEWTACDRCGATLVYSASWAAYFHYGLSAPIPGDVRRVTPPCLPWPRSRLPGYFLYLGLVPLKPEQHLALPRARPRPTTSHTVRDSVARSVLGRVSTSPRGSRSTPRV